MRVRVCVCVCEYEFVFFSYAYENVLTDVQQNPLVASKTLLDSSLLDQVTDLTGHHGVLGLFQDLVKECDKLAI